MVYISADDKQLQRAERERKRMSFICSQIDL